MNLIVCEHVSRVIYDWFFQQWCIGRPYCENLTVCSAYAMCLSSYNVLMIFHQICTSWLYIGTLIVILKHLLSRKSSFNLAANLCILIRVHSETHDPNYHIYINCVCHMADDILHQTESVRDWCLTILCLFILGYAILYNRLKVLII